MRHLDRHSPERRDESLNTYNYLGTVWAEMEKEAWECGCDGEIVVSGRQAWYGLEQTSPALVMALVRACVISPVMDEKGQGPRYYTINETGRKILKKETNN